MILLPDSSQMLTEATFEEIRDNLMSCLSLLVLAGILPFCGQFVIKVSVPLQRNCGLRTLCLHILRYASAGS